MGSANGLLGRTADEWFAEALRWFVEEHQVCPCCSDNTAYSARSGGLASSFTVPCAISGGSRQPVESQHRRAGDTAIRLAVVSHREIAQGTVELDARPPLRAEYAVPSLTAGTCLVFFHVPAKGLSEPLVCRSAQEPVRAAHGISPRRISGRPLTVLHLRAQLP